MLGRLNKVNKNYEKNNDKSLLSKRTDSFYKNEENITYDKIDVLEKKSKMFYFSKNKQNNGYRDFDSELEFNNSKEKMQFYNFRNEDLSITDHDCLKLEFDNQEEIIEDIELNINSGYLPLTTGNEYRVTS